MFVLRGDPSGVRVRQHGGGLNVRGAEARAVGEKGSGCGCRCRFPGSDQVTALSGFFLRLSGVFCTSAGLCVVGPRRRPRARRPWQRASGAAREVAGRGSRAAAAGASGFLGACALQPWGRSPGELSPRCCGAQKRGGASGFPDSRPLRFPPAGVSLASLPGGEVTC